MYVCLRPLSMYVCLRRPSVCVCMSQAAKRVCMYASNIHTLSYFSIKLSLQRVWICFKNTTKHRVLKHTYTLKFLKISKSDTQTYYINISIHTLSISNIHTYTLRFVCKIKPSASMDLLNKHDKTRGFETYMHA